MAPINIHGNVIDPGKPHPIQLPSDASKTKFILLQCSRRLTVEEGEAIEQLGAKVLSVEAETVSQTTYLCRYEKDDLRALEKLDVVQHALVYISDFVTEPSLKDASATNGDSTRSASDIAVTISLHDSTEETGQDLLQEIKSIGKGELIDAGDNQLRVRLPSSSLDHVAKLDYVKSIERTKVIDPRTRIAHDIIHAGMPVAPAGNVLRGEGEVIAVADHGLDLGDVNNIHPAFKDANGTTRVRGILNATGEKNHPLYDSGGHGTHVAACAVGAMIDEAMPEDDSYGIYEINAPASRAGLVFQVIKPGDHIAPNLNTLFTEVSGDPYQAKIHSNSWGTRPFKGEQEGYTMGESLLIDRAMQQDEELLVVWAAGNDGAKLTQHELEHPLSLTKWKYVRQIGAEAAAKNAITVGGTLNCRRFRHSDPTYCVDGVEDERDQVRIANDAALWLQSSKGPTRELRLKPDIVAPAAGILSARTRQMPATQQNMSKEELLQLYDEVHQGDGKTPTRHFCFLNGTSQAAPQVAGCAAVLRQALKNKPVKPIAHPNGSLIKALLVNGARDLVNNRFQAPNVATGNPLVFVMPAAPNTAQGFGAVDLQQSLKSVYPRLVGEGDAQEYPPLNQNAANTFDILVPAGKNNLRLTMAYTDKPGVVISDILNLSLTMQNANGGAWGNLVLPDPIVYLPWQRDPNAVAPVPVEREPVNTLEQHGLVFTHNNVQRITCSVANISRVQVRVTATAITPPTGSSLGHSCCWLFY
ncbi:hypothetical protein N0V90_006022 [Kalmusia sp. IMI 367209]|nr:hypothetical protein N0V90_006022 [Kalmusia sp. IMI 367209]